MSSTYERVQALRAEGKSQAVIAEAIGKSRQYVHQLLHRDSPPVDAHHGTITRAASCNCPRCADTRKTFERTLPDVLRRMRAGETLSAISEGAGYVVVAMVTIGRRHIAAGQPTLLRELVEVYDETLPLRPRGRPKNEA